MSINMQKIILRTYLVFLASIIVQFSIYKIDIFYFYSIISLIVLLMINLYLIPDELLSYAVVKLRKRHLSISISNIIFDIDTGLLSYSDYKSDIEELERTIDIYDRFLRIKKNQMNIKYKNF